MVGLDLSGTWEFWPDHEGAGDRRMAWLPEFRGGRWHPVRVPGFWQEQGFVFQGVGWYRKRFHWTPDQPGHCPFLAFDGVDYRGEVWLNGAYLGFHEGGYDPFEFAVDGLLAEGANLLVVRVEGPLDQHPEHKQVAKGGTYHWDCLPVCQAPGPAVRDVPSTANPHYPWPVENPAGIWQPVRLVQRPELHLAGLRVQPLLAADLARADLVVEACIRNLGAEPVIRALELAVAPDNFAGAAVLRTAPELFLPPGESRHTLRMELEHPALWWPRGMGCPHLYRLTAQLNGQETAVRFGLRRAEKGPNWELYLNGRRFFARGTNYLSDRYLTRATPERYRQDLELMLDAHMNMVRVFAHPEHDHFYDRCDELGLLVYQDLPFQWGYSDQGPFIDRAAGVARRVVERLAHHPSIFLWCCHSESRLHDYNKLDEVLIRTVRSADPTRPVIKDSVLAAPDPLPRFFRTVRDLDRYTRAHLSVLWSGWYWGRADDVRAYDPLFVTEFGTQALPGRESMAAILPRRELWPPDWRAWRHLGFQDLIYQKNLGPIPDTLDEMIRRSQEYQAYFYKRAIEALRRKKYRPVNGLLQFHLVDAWPALTWSVVDYFRRPKPGYEAVQAAFAPILLSFTADWRPESPAEVTAWVVNDLHHHLADCTILMTIGTREGRSRTEVAETVAAIPADSAGAYVSIAVPVRRGRLHRRLLVRGELRGPDGEVIAANSDELVPPVRPPAPVPRMT